MSQSHSIRSRGHGTVLPWLQHIGVIGQPVVVADRLVVGLLVLPAYLEQKVVDRS